MKVIINLGKGNLKDGCHSILVQLLDSGQCWRQLSGSLPPAPRLARLLQQWQNGYQGFYSEQTMRISLLQSEGFRYSDADFKQICSQIADELNNWLSCPSFATIETALRTELNRKQPIQIIITTADAELQQLPWHLWNFIEDYGNAEIALSPLNWQKMDKSKVSRPKVRILMILGNSVGIDLKQDLESLKSLPEAELVILVEPEFTKLNEYLWQPQGWDIFLFSGHSHSDVEAGYIYLNASEKITIAQLKKSLTKAIALGLQIAIFNSCQGMGLAQQIADLSLPYVVVMSQPVPDKIAQLFLKYFLTAFAAGSTFSLAVKEARHKLIAWESEYVCASWLPVIWQNPSINSLGWSDLETILPEKKTAKLIKTSLLSSLAVSSLVMVVRSLSLLQPFELWAYDRLMQQRPAEVIDPRIVVVEVTEEDINSDRYPISDKVLVEAIEILEEYQPAAIGLDIHRSVERGTGYQDLIGLFENNSNIFPVCAYGGNNKSYAPPQGLSETKLTQQMGFSDLLIDRYTSEDNYYLSSTTPDLKSTPKVRRQLLSYDPDLATGSSKCLTPYSLSFQLAYEYLHRAGVDPLTVDPQQQWQFGEVTFKEMTSKFGGYQRLDGDSSQIPINYRSGHPGKQISLNQLRSGKIQPQLIKDRIVLIGYTTDVARDYFDTPYGIIPGVWIHAHMTSQMISAVQDGRPLIWVLPQWGDWLWILWWSVFTGGVMVILHHKPIGYSFLALGILTIAMDRFYILILINGGWLPYIPTLLSLLIVSGVVLSCRKQYQLIKISL